MSIIQQHLPELNFLAHFTGEDFKTEIRKLKNQIAIEKSELSELEEANKVRPYRPEFMTTMRRGYRNSSHELHSQIQNVRAMISVQM